MIFSSLRCSLKNRQARRATRRLLKQARGAQRRMAIFEGAALRGGGRRRHGACAAAGAGAAVAALPAPTLRDAVSGPHFAHGGVISRLFGAAKPHAFFLALHKMAVRRRDEKIMNRLLEH